MGPNALFSGISLQNLKALALPISETLHFRWPKKYKMSHVTLNMPILSRLILHMARVANSVMSSATLRAVAPPERGKGGSFPHYGWTSKNYVICVCFAVNVSASGGLRTLDPL